MPRSNNNYCYETITIQLLSLWGFIRFNLRREFNLSVLPFRGGMVSEHIGLQPFPIPSFPALFCEDTTYSWNTDYRCNTPCATTKDPGSPRESRESSRGPRGVHGRPRRVLGDTGSPREVPGESPGVQGVVRESPA